MASVIEEAAIAAAIKAYDTNAGLAVRAVFELVHGIVQGNGLAGLADALAEAYPALVAEYGYTHANVALEMYNAMRGAADLNDGHTTTLSYEKVAKIAYDMARHDLVGMSYDDEERVASELAGKAVSDCGTISDRCLTSWAYNDPAKPRCAIVPEPGACAWCRMIASRGFVYAVDMQPSRHPNCRCRSVVSFASHPKIKGYDPDALKQEWKDAYNDASGKSNDKRDDALRKMNQESGYWKQKYALGKSRDEEDESTS